MAQTIKRGYACKLYRNTANFVTPTWDEVSALGDVQLNLAFDEFDATVRGDGVKLSEPTLLGIEVTGRIRSDENSTDFTAFETAALTRASLDVLVLDGTSTTNGSRGIRAEMKLFNWSEDQALGNVLFREFTLKPCLSENARQSVVVSAGAPVLTALS